MEYVPYNGEIYRYVKTRNSKQLSFGIRETYEISKISDYDLPSEDDMRMQAIDQMICEVCMYCDQCYMGNCIANASRRDEMQRMLFAATKGKLSCDVERVLAKDALEKYV